MLGLLLFSVFIHDLGIVGVAGSALFCGIASLWITLGPLLLAWIGTGGMGIWAGGCGGDLRTVGM